MNEHDPRDSDREEFDTEERGKRPRRIRIGTAILGIFLVSGLAVVLLSSFIAVRPDNAIGMAVRRVFPFPVVLVSGTFVGYRELDEDRESVRRFYESQSRELADRGYRVDFSTPEGQKRLLIREKDILNKLVEDRMIIAFARARGVLFSDDDIRAKVEETIRDESGDREVLESRLRSLYGWSFEDFQQKIVIPSLYRDALEAIFMKERDVSKAKEAIANVSRELEQGVSFEEVAEKFSEGESKMNRGDLGWVSLEALVPELRAPAEEQAIDAVGPVIESTLGYHILMVTERSGDAKGDMVRLKQIFIRKPSFPDWLVAEKRKETVLILPRRYIWDVESGSVVFRDEEMRAFEKRALEQSEGDPSLVF